MEINLNNLGGWAIGSKLFSWITKNIPHGSIILELGSGSGSHELGKFYKIHCVEHDKNWINKYPNIVYHYAPIKEGWYDTEWLQNLPKDYSLLLIDGPPGTIGRTQILKNLDLFNLNVPIIVDDTNREAEKYIANQLVITLGASFIEVKDDKSAYIINA